MIHVVVNKPNNAISVTGHANDALHPRCDDSMRACEIITFSTQSLLAGIKKLGKDSPFYELDRGHFYIETTGLSEVSRTLVDSFIVGVKLASTAYPQYISVSEKTKSRRG